MVYHFEFLNIDSFNDKAQKLGVNEVFYSNGVYYFNFENAEYEYKGHYEPNLFINKI